MHQRDTMKWRRVANDIARFISHDLGTLTGKTIAVIAIKSGLTYRRGETGQSAFLAYRLVSMPLKTKVYFYRRLNSAAITAIVLSQCSVPPCICSLLFIRGCSFHCSFTIHSFRFFLEVNKRRAKEKIFLEKGRSSFS